MDGTETSIRVKRVVKHPLYDGTRSGFAHNIALLELETPVKLSNHIRMVSHINNTGQVLIFTICYPSPYSYLIFCKYVAFCNVNYLTIHHCFVAPPQNIPDNKHDCMSQYNFRDSFIFTQQIFIAGDHDNIVVVFFCCCCCFLFFFPKRCAYQNARETKSWKAPYNMAP